MHAFEFATGTFMARRKWNETGARELRDAAMQAVMARGGLEPSGGAKLAVLREGDVMIGYRTPFNPLPKPSEALKYKAALAGRTRSHEAYGIDVWSEGSGKVFSAAWTTRDELRVELLKPGAWQDRITALAAPPDAARQPPRPTPLRAAERAIQSLERENRQLRRTIAGLTLDRLVLSQAAAGDL
jgi:hypothetical protein